MSAGDAAYQLGRGWWQCTTRAQIALLRYVLFALEWKSVHGYYTEWHIDAERFLKVTESRTH